MPESISMTSKLVPGKESLQDRAKAWVVDQAAICVLELGRCTVDVVAEAIDVPVNALLSVIQTTDRLSVVDGDVDLSVCNDTVSRSLDRWCSDVVKAVGSAITIDDLAEFLTVHLGKSSDSIEASIRSSCANSRSGLTIVDNQVLHNDWLPMLDHDEQEDVLLENGVKADLMAALLAKVKGQTLSNIGDFTASLLRAVQNKPVRHKTLAVTYWSHCKRNGAADDLAQLLRDNRLLWHSGPKGGRWVLATIEAQYRNALCDLIPVPEELGEATIQESYSTPESKSKIEPEFVVDAERMQQILNHVHTNEDGITLMQFGIPSDLLPIYTSTLESHEAVVTLGHGRYTVTQWIPDIDTHEIGTVFSIPIVEFISEDGEQVEDLIPPESYIGSLKFDVGNPSNQDILDDSASYTGCMSDELVTFPLYTEHVRFGVIPLSRLPDTLVPWNVAYSPIWVHRNSEIFKCSLVNKFGVRCLMGLSACFAEIDLSEDYIVSVSKGDEAGHITLELSPLVDGEYAVSTERRSELDVYKETEADNPTVVILTQILDDHPKGVSFERALRELRYIRRTSVHKLASILTTNDCFAQKPGTGVWRYNPKRADAGNDIARRTYLKSGF